MRKIIKKIIVCLISLLVLFLIVTICFPFGRSQKNKLGEYENIIGDNLNNKDAKIVDIAMLGAHDAFSNDINIFSEPNVNEGGIAVNELVNSIGKPIFKKMSRAQVDDAKHLLYAGVRYFDVRVTKINDVYYTCHGLLSNTLESYVKDIIEFLNNHPKEFVIFDIQHFYTNSGENYNIDISAYNDLYNFLDNQGLTEYVNYTTITELKDLTYNSVTNNATKGGCIMLAKVNNHDKFYSRNDTNIRSEWHDTMSSEELVNGIEKEYEYITNNSLTKNALRVNQAQKTGFQTDISLASALFQYSLIGIASNSNAMLIKDVDRFNKWLDAMPIFMVDYTSSNYGNFNKLANKSIIDYNSKL